jgi:hypothetical protein
MPQEKHGYNSNQMRGGSGLTFYLRGSQVGLFELIQSRASWRTKVGNMDNCALKKKEIYCVVYIVLILYEQKKMRQL